METGTHLSLLEHDGLYAKFYRTQALQPPPPKEIANDKQEQETEKHDTEDHKIVHHDTDPHDADTHDKHD